ncbi:MAG: polysaccharide biosynthesis tyrosine autokinase [Pirellulales bacterium]|nr:polysaccharide biosynthesis tyrosine autokinase [Pirellulales bacterium]
MSQITRRQIGEGQLAPQSSKKGSVAVSNERFVGAKHDAGISPRTILNALRFWWKWTVPVSLLLAGIAGATVFYLFEPKYEADALIQIREATPYLAFAPSREDGQSGRGFVSTQVELLRDRLVLGSVVSKSDIRKPPELIDSQDPIVELAELISVRAVGKSELYKIVLTSSDPEAAAETVNAIVESYFDLRGKKDAENVRRTIEILEEESKRRLNKIHDLRETLRKSAEAAGLSAGIISAAEVGGVVRHPLADLRERLNVAEVNKEILTASKEAAEEMVNKPIEVPESMIEQRLNVNMEVKRIESRIGDLREEQNEMGIKLTHPSQYSKYQQLEKDIARMEKIRDEYRSKLKDQIKTEIEQELRKERHDVVVKLDNDLQSCAKMVELYSQKYESQYQTLQDESAENIKLKFGWAELERSEEVVKRISDRTIALQTEIRAPTRVSKLREAQVPLAPVEVLPFKNMAVAMGGAFILPFALAVFWERLARRISGPEHLKKDSRLDIVGEISRLPVRRVGSSDKRVDVAMQLFEESVDALRTNLALCPDAGDLHVLAVTSAANNEGKTSVATQLARSLGRANRKPVLLVDGDLRSPDLHHIFQIPLEPGLAQVLSGECSLEDAVAKQADKYVNVLPAGVTNENIHSLFAAGKIRQFFSEAAKSYDFVIVDTPPVLAAAESLVIGAAADGMLVCAMRDVSRGDQMERVCERLSKAGVRSLGTVLNGIPCRQYSYYHGRYPQHVS